MYQLIVIGNGFDLSCDLKSSFSDFHDYRAKSDLVAHPENTTIWDLILKQEKGHNWRWCDVEHQIRRWLYKSGQKDPQMLRLPECVLDPSVKPSQTARTNAVYSYVLSNWLRDRKLDGSVLAALSLADLNRYESYFATYLNDLVQRTPGYLDSAATRMERICRDLVDEDGVPPPRPPSSASTTPSPCRATFAFPTPSASTASATYTVGRATTSTASSSA